MDLSYSSRLVKVSCYLLGFVYLVEMVYMAVVQVTIFLLYAPGLHLGVPDLFLRLTGMVTSVVMMVGIWHEMQYLLVPLLAQLVTWILFNLISGLYRYLEYNQFFILRDFGNWITYVETLLDIVKFTLFFVVLFQRKDMMNNKTYQMKRRLSSAVISRENSIISKRNSMISQQISILSHRHSIVSSPQNSFSSDRQLSISPQLSFISDRNSEHFENNMHHRYSTLAPHESTQDFCIILEHTEEDLETDSVPVDTECQPPEPGPPPYYATL